MAVRLILGRAGAGKTHACVQALLAELDRPQEERRLILLVPEQASFQMERTLALRAARRGYWRAQVLSFSRLATQILAAESGPQLLGPMARALALRRLADAGALRALHRAARASGFHLELGRLLDELIREEVTPAALCAAATRLANPRMARKTRELADLYAAYVDWLGPHRCDTAGRLALVRARLAQADWLPDASIWVDGFAGFTGQELQTLITLARLARELTVTLLVDPASPAVQSLDRAPDELGLFARTEVTYQRLLRLLADAQIAVAPPVRLDPADAPRFRPAAQLARLEAGLAVPESVVAANPAEERSAVRIVVCATHRDELRAAARWIRATLVTSGGALRYRDFALIARTLEPFAALVDEVFTEYDIPHFLDRRRPMRSHPLSRLVPALFEAVLSDFEVRPLVRLLRTRLLPLERDSAEQLESIVVRYGVRGMNSWRRSAWELERAGESTPAFAAQRLAVVAGLQPLADVAAVGPASGAAWATALWTVLDRLGVRERLEAWSGAARRQRRWEHAEIHRLAWTALCEMLAGLHEVLHDTLLPAEEVARLLGTALRDLTLGLAPPALDQVLVSSIERSRHPDVKHAWVFAFNEGIFPARPAEDLLLSTAERTALAAVGLPAPASHKLDPLGERLLAYIACTRASHSLTVSYATAGDDGAERLPSSLLAEIHRALPEATVVRDDTDEPPAHLYELARRFLAVRRDPRRPDKRARLARLCTEIRRVPHLAGPLHDLLRGIHYANECAAIENFRGRGAVAWTASPSEIETYLQCPFQHFLRYGLRLDAASGPQPLRWDLGLIAHRVLAAVTQRAAQEPGGVGAVSDARWDQLLDQALAESRAQQPVDHDERRPDLAFLGGLLANFLRDLVQAHAERWRRGRFQPHACEQAFHPAGGAGNLPGLRLHLPQGAEIHVRGYIDRIDLCHADDQTLALVYDYKSQAGTLAADWLTGERLQIVTYLAALQQGFGATPPLRPAGVLLAPLYPDLEALDTQAAAAADPRTQLMFLYRPRGLVSTDAADALDPALGAGPSPVAQLQRRKDGGYHANSDARRPEEIDALLELARATVLHAATGVCGGCIEIAPLVERRTLACRRCDYARVCRFERAYNRPRAAEAVLPRLPPTSAGESGA